MYREYAADPRMRINLGIRRRLAPLIGNSRPRIELLNSLLFSMPGTPVIYYGDEIGMGDNIYLGDRNGVRTPMQWTGDRNAGFSRCDFNRLYSPPIIDPVYGYQSINVEAQQREASSLLNWMKRIIALRKRFKAFGRGTIEFLSPRNRKILAYLRALRGRADPLRGEPLAVRPAGASSTCRRSRGTRRSRCSGGSGSRPIGDGRIPADGRADGVHLVPARTGLAGVQSRRRPRSRSRRPSRRRPRPPTSCPVLTMTGGWETLMEGKYRAVLERTVLPGYMQAQRWFGAKSRTLETLSIRDWVAAGHRADARLPGERPGVLQRRPVRHLHGADGRRRRAPRPRPSRRRTPRRVIARLKGPAGEGSLYDSTANDAFCARLLDLIGSGGEHKTQNGRLRGRRHLGPRPRSGATAPPGADPPGVGRAEQHDPLLRRPAPAEDVPPARTGDEPRLRDRPVPDREDDVHPGPQDGRRDRVPQGAERAGRRSPSSRSWCPTRGRGGSGSSASSAATSSRWPARRTGSSGSRRPAGHLLELSESEPPGTTSSRSSAPPCGRRRCSAGGRPRCTWPWRATRTTRPSPPSR